MLRVSLNISILEVKLFLLGNVHYHVRGNSSRVNLNMV